MGLADDCIAYLSYLRDHTRPAFVTAPEFVQWKERDPNAVGNYEAARIARFLRQVAVEAGVSELVEVADAAVAKADEMSRRRAGGSETNLYEVWAQRDVFEERARAELRDRPARWETKDLVTTSDISGMLWPTEKPGFGTTYLFGVLKELGYVDGEARAWTLTDLGALHGEIRKKRYIYWKKEMLETLRAQLRRRAPPSGFSDPDFPPSRRPV